jgi:hypothetical protein
MDSEEDMIGVCHHLCQEAKNMTPRPFLAFVLPGVFMAASFDSSRELVAQADREIAKWNKKLGQILGGTGRKRRWARRFLTTEQFSCFVSGVFLYCGKERSRDDILRIISVPTERNTARQGGARTSLLRSATAPGREFADQSGCGHSRRGPNGIRATCPSGAFAREANGSRHPAVLPYGTPVQMTMETPARNASGFTKGKTSEGDSPKESP